MSSRQTCAMNWPCVEGSDQPHGVDETPPASEGKKAKNGAPRLLLYHRRNATAIETNNRRVDLDQPPDNYQQDRPNIADKSLIIKAFRHPSCPA
jgi:hypothetical protein